MGLNVYGSHFSFDRHIQSVEQLRLPIHHVLFVSVSFWVCEHTHEVCVSV